jgi:predicted Ser/Thr protein kinase
VYFPKHFSPPLSKEGIFKKRELIKRVAILARDFHRNGLNHQDFYLGHLFIRQGDGEIFIIDIQRVHQRQKSE